MRILLDENLPRKLVAALRSEGHNVESIHTLRLQGLENGKLYEFAALPALDESGRMQAQTGVSVPHLLLARSLSPQKAWVMVQFELWGRINVWSL